MPYSLLVLKMSVENVKSATLINHKVNLIKATVGNLHGLF